MENYINIVREIQKVVNERLKYYNDGLRRLDESWNSYRESVNGLKREWDSEYPLIEARINQLKLSIDELRRRLEELNVKRDIGLIDEQAFTKMANEINAALDEVEKIYDELRNSLSQLENGIVNHWIRSLDVSSMSQEAVQETLKMIDEARSNGQLSDEVYSRLRRELETLLRALQAYEILVKG